MNKKHTLQKALSGAALAILLMTSSALFAQVKVGDNPTTIAPGSAVEIESGTKGLRLPQVSLTNTQVWAPLAGSGAAPTSAGMTVFNTNPAITSTGTKYPADGIGEYYWDGSGWVRKNATTTPNLSVVWSATLAGTTQAMLGNVWTDINFASVNYDKNNSYNLASKTFTVPAGGRGFYSLNTIFATSPAALQTGMYVGISVNGSVQKYVAIANCVAGAGMAGGGSGIFELAAGDVVKVQYLVPYPTSATGINLTYLQFDLALVSL